MFGHLLLLHIIDQLIDIIILDLLLIPLHYILHVLIHHIHALLLSHEPLHGLLIVIVLHLVIGSAHYFGHPRHHVGHGFVDAHLLQLESDSLQLGVQLVVFGYHLVVLQNLVGQHLLGLLNKVILTAGSFFSIFFLRSFCNCFDWN